jgi:hypothetical protein
MRQWATDERSRSEPAITIPGIGDHDAPESMIRIERNERSRSPGTGDQDGPEPSLEGLRLAVDPLSRRLVPVPGLLLAHPAAA